MKNFYDREAECEQTLASLGPVYHLWTPENFEIIFTCEEDFVAGMNIIGITAKLHNMVSILTFQIMTNHLHMTLFGKESDILMFFEDLKQTLSIHFKRLGRTIDWKKFTCKLRQLKTLGDVRNVIVYNNKNGYLVSPDHTPFSYPWGANKYFFNQVATRFDIMASHPFTIRERRKAIHNHKADALVGLSAVDSYLSPICYCHIKTAESLFRDASHYFNRLTKNIESQKEIAKEIGESIFYTDDELYSVLCKFSREKYGISQPKELPADAKQDAARMLHFEYNAPAKQICRMLKLPMAMITAMGIRA